MTARPEPEHHPRLFPQNRKKSPSEKRRAQDIRYRRRSCDWSISALVEKYGVGAVIEAIGEIGRAHV